MGRGDAGAGGGDGDGAFAPIGLGDEADIRRAGVQPQYGEAVPCSGRLDGDSAAAPQAAARRLEEWLAERFRRHRGNCDVVRQDLMREHAITVSLRTVEPAAAPLRQALRAEARACLRFQTAPDQQLQIDFGATTVAIGGVPVRAHLFVATLGYSRRAFVRAFRQERQSAWFDGMEGAFQRFGGVPQEVLFDVARALVDHHDASTREVRFNERLHAFDATGASGRTPARRTGRAPSAKTSAGSVTSSAMRLRVMRLTAGRRSRRIWSGGCARLPTSGCTVRPARRRWCVSNGTRQRRSIASMAGRRSGRRASWSAGFRPIVRSRSTATATACRGD